MVALKGLDPATREAVEKFDALNKEWLGSGQTDEAAHGEKVIEALMAFTPSDYRPLDDGDGPDHGLQLVTLFSSPHTVVVAVYLDPGAVISPHDHKDFFGVMRVLEGPLTVKNYAYSEGGRKAEGEAVGLVFEGSSEPNAGDSCKILTKTGNVHEVVAGPQGGSFIDVYTMYQNPGSCRIYTGEGPVEQGEVKDMLPEYDFPIA